MNCLLPLLGICLFNPSNLVLTGEASWQAAGHVQYQVGGPSGYRLVTGPVGRAAIEMLIPLTHNFSLDWGYEHRSIITTNQDRGEERAFVGFAWRPFGAN